MHSFAIRRTRIKSRLIVVVIGLLPLLTAMAADEKGFVVLPDRAPRFSGAQGREADITEILATSEQTGGPLGLFRQTIAPKSGPPLRKLTTTSGYKTMIARWQIHLPYR